MLSTNLLTRQVEMPKDTVEDIMREMTVLHQQLMKSEGAYNEVRAEIAEQT